MPEPVETIVPVVSLVVPTYNERESIGPLVKRAAAALESLALPFEIIVVDDDSPDGTWQLAEGLRQEFPMLRVIRRQHERGLARAVVRGWSEAGGELLLVMDGDLQHPPDVLPRIVQALRGNGADVAVASRHVAGGGVSRWNVIRRALSWSASLAATWMLPGTLRTIRDPMSGYFGIRRSSIAACRLDPEGYKILLEVLARGRYDFVEEVPYTFIERQHGGSKLGLRQYAEFIVHLFRLAAHTGELTRLLRFAAVGASGVIVNVGMLVFATSRGLHYLAAGGLAIETSIAWNFALNELWSFRDFAQRDPRLAARATRFLKFNLFCAGGALLNLAVLWGLTALAGLDLLVSNFVGIGAAMVWNYGTNANVTWDSARGRRR
jgi:dolichol-phosphate mannosyltransferase